MAGNQMEELAYALLSIAVFFSGALLGIIALDHPQHLGSLRTASDLRVPARWGYVVIAVASWTISMGDLPRSRQDADLLWIVPISIVMDGLLWPLALARRVAPDAWSNEEY